MQMMINNIQDDVRNIRASYEEEDDASDSDTETDTDTHSIAECIHSISTIPYGHANNKYIKNNAVFVINSYLHLITENIRKYILK